MTALNNACVPPHNGKVAARSGPIDVYCPRVPNLVDPFREMLEGSPTTAALLAGTTLNLCLEFALRGRFPPDEKVFDEVFSESGTLGTLTDKLAIAYAMRLFGPTLYSDLLMVQAIRDKFADGAARTFEDTRVASTIGAIRIVETWRDAGEDFASLQTEFAFAVRALWIVLLQEPAGIFNA